MTVNDSDRDSGSVHPQRGLRKRWITLLVICVCLVSLGIWLFQESSVAVVKLPDGRTFNIHKTTLGKQHAYHKASTGLTSAEIWVNKWLVRVGREIIASSRNVAFLSTSPTICFWHSFSWSDKESESAPHWIVLTDERGWKVANKLSYMYGQPNPLPAAPGSPVVPRFFTMQMPASSSMIKIELLNSRGHNLGSTQIPYSIPMEQLQNVNLRPLPITSENGNMSVTLVDVKAEWSKPDKARPWFGDILSVNPQYVVTIDGNISEDWIPFSTGVPFLESYSGTQPVVASIESPSGVTAPLDRCTVSPFESVWRLHLSLICRDPSQATSAQVVTFTGISFEGGIASNPALTHLPSNSEAKVKFLGAGRAGSYLYEGAGEGGFPILEPLPLADLTGERLEGIFKSAYGIPMAGFNVGFMSPNGATVRPPQQPLAVHLDLTAVRPHLVISVIDSGDRYPYVVVKDQKGQVLQGELYNAQGLLIWLAKFPYTDIETVDAEVLLQTPRYFSFDVMPPAVPPRDSSEPLPSK